MDLFISSFLHSFTFIQQTFEYLVYSNYSVFRGVWGGIQGAHILHELCGMRWNSNKHTAAYDNGSVQSDVEAHKGKIRLGTSVALGEPF